MTDDDQHKGPGERLLDELRDGLVGHGFSAYGSDPDEPGEELRRRVITNRLFTTRPCPHWRTIVDRQVRASTRAERRRADRAAKRGYLATDRPWVALLDFNVAACADCLRSFLEGTGPLAGTERVPDTDCCLCLRPAPGERFREWTFMVGPIAVIGNLCLTCAERLGLPPDDPS